MSFRIITPVNITDAKLVSSSIAEPDLSKGEQAYFPDIPYVRGSKVYTPDHRIFESVMEGSNFGNDPYDDVQGDPDNPPAHWLDTKTMTNKWTMFNLLRNLKSECPSPLTFTITPEQRCDAFGLFGIEADTVTITETVAGEEVFSYTENLNQRIVLSWYDYLTQPFKRKPSTVNFELPPYSNGEITVTLTSSTGTVRLGSFVVGKQTVIGDVQYEAESDVLNFSRVEREFDGTTLLTQRRSVPKTTQTVLAPKALTNKIRELRESLNAIPAVWAGIDQTEDEYFEPLLILGIYKKFAINLVKPEVISISLEVEEI